MHLKVVNSKQNDSHEFVEVINEISNQFLLELRHTSFFEMADHLFFLDPSNKLQKSTIYTADQLNIETNSGGGVTHQKFSVIVEKHNLQNLIQIRLSSVNDKTSMFVCSIDDIRFESFKMEQSLHVSFDGFVKHLIQILESCRKARLNVCFSMQQGMTGQLQFYEKGTFKNLVHINLPIEPAPVELILLTLTQSYASLQEVNQQSAQKCSVLEVELMQRNDRIERLNETIQQLKNDLSEQEKASASKIKQQMNQLEKEFKHINDTKDFQKQELEKQTAAFRTRVDTLVKENYNLQEQLKKETSLTTQLRNENKKLKENLIGAKEEIETLKNGQSGQRISAQKHDHILKELRKQVTAMEEKLNLCEKQKSETLAELDAVKNLCQIKRNALKMSSEDICNANSIIRKQAAEIATLKEKIAWRTEVSLKQEKVIHERGKENEKARNLLEFVGDAVQSNAEQSEEIKNKLEGLKLKADSIELKYKNRLSEVLQEITYIDGNGRASLSTNRRF